MARLLDKILCEVSLNSSKYNMEMSRFPGFEWDLNCDGATAMGGSGSKFTCDANVGKMKVVLYKSELVRVL